MAETPWLSEEQMHAWLGLMAVTILVPAGLDARMRTDTGLTMYEYLVLAMLSEVEPDAGGMHVTSASVLAARARSSLSRLSHAAARLESRELIERHPSSANRRVTLITLTEKGMAELVLAAPGHVRDVRALVFDHLDERDIADLGRVADKILAGIGAPPADLQGPDSCENHDPDSGRPPGLCASGADREIRYVRQDPFGSVGQASGPQAR